MAVRFALVVMLLPAVALAADGATYAPPPAKEGHAYPDCYCTDSEGRRVEMGESACLTIGRRRVTARCFMSQNSPGWRTEAEGCPSV